MANGHGGRRKGSGRKPKTDEIKLIEMLDKVIDPEAALKKLAELIEKKDSQAINIYMKYRHGLPKQIVDLNHNLESGDKIVLNYEPGESADVS